MAFLATPGRVSVLVAGGIFALLAALELWLGARSALLPGMVAGAGVLGLLGAATALVMTRPRGWQTIAAAALLSLGEFVLGAAVVAATVTAAVVLLPLSISARLLPNAVMQDLVVFGFLGLAAWIAFRAWVRHSRRSMQADRAELESAQAFAELAERERQLAASELMLLRAQVEPHFLWNTLGHVQHLIRRNPADADRLTGHLIRYLRTALPDMRKEMSTLGAEFSSSHAYLELMKMRMGERLTARVDLPGQLQDEPFAPLLLQTLVENAIKHGVEPKVGPVSVEVVASVDGDMLQVDVRDNGVGLHAASGTAGSGLGLRNVRQRLALLHPEAGSLSVAQALAGGVVASIRVPRQPALRDREPA